MGVDRLHNDWCDVQSGNACDCNLPGALRDVEDEAMGPWVSHAAWVEGKTKGMGVHMSGDTSGHPASPERSKEIWRRTNEMLNSLPDEPSGCMCGTSILEHRDRSKIRYCHFGWHREDCDEA